MNITEEKCYHMGRAAHTQGLPITACDVVKAHHAAWWKAGWHDADIEAGNSVLQGAH